MARKKYHSGIDLQGGDLANAGFEAVTSLPATGNFTGRQVTYQGRSYIWNGSVWTNDTTTLGGSDKTTFFQNGAVVMNTNPFGGRQLYINSLDNAMYAANKRFSVVVTRHLVSYNGETYPKLNPDYISSYGVTGSGTSFNVINSPSDILVYNNNTLCSEVSTPTTQNQYSYSGGILTFGSQVTGTIYIYPKSNLAQYLDSPVVYTYNPPSLIFDGSYESVLDVPSGYYMKIRIMGDANENSFSSVVGYPYGSLFLSYYYNLTPGSAQLRIYNKTYRPHGIGWKKYDFIDFIGNNSGTGYIQSYYSDGDYGRSIMEFIIIAHNAHSTQLSEIDWRLDRPSLSQTGATVTKYSPQTLYYPLTVLDKVISNETINFDTSNIEPTQTGTVTKTSTWLWQYLVQSVKWLRTTLANHNHDTDYLGKSAQALDSTKLGGQLASYYEPAFSKNSAFNKDFGTTSGKVASGDHSHSDLHSHSNKAILDSISAAFTTSLKAFYDGAVSNSHTHSNKAILDSISAAFTTALKSNYDTAYNNSHTHGNTTALNAVSGTNTGDENTTRIGALVNGATAKATPIDADMVGLMDSAATNVLKKLSWANIKSTLKTYFDTLYSKLTFYRIKVGSTYITSTTSSDTLEFVAGSNVTLTPDSTNKKITIEASGSGGGVDQVQVDFDITNISDVRYILNKPAENRSVYVAPGVYRLSTLVDRKFQVNPGAASGNYNEGIRIGNSSQNYSLLALGVDSTTDTGVNPDGNQWHLIKFPNGNIAICQGSDVSTGLSMEKGGDIYWRNTKLNGSGGSTIGLPHVQITLISLERIIGKGLEVFFSREIFEYDTPEFDDELLWDDLEGSFNLAANKRYEVMINIGFLINSGSGLIRINLNNSNGLIKRTGQTFLDGYACLSMTCLVDGGTSISFDIEKSNPDMEITLLTQECWFAIHEI